ncbi:MAG: hypothetical protein BV456_06105 [Thermoplasmata archaeon M8B2D]|nr:MAG: hypothetical protein BV456_06105 [Thermoplasmata archaeon M8B2D]
MQINGLLSDLFLKIANRLGFELQPKQYFYNDFYDVSNISLTSILSDRLSTLIVADSDISIDGNRNIDTLQKVIDEFFKIKLKTSVMTSLGTGDCLIIPITDGRNFGIDIVENNRFQVINSMGETIYSIVIERDSFVRGNNTYKRFEYHGLEIINDIPVCKIRRYGYIDDREVDINSVDVWRDIPKETIIPNVDRLLFGRLKCPTVNRENINSSQGVPITYGLDVAVGKAKESYIRFNDEFARKQTKIFAGKQLFKKDKDDNIYLPDGGVFQMVKTDLEGNMPIKEFSPDLRYNDLRGGVEFNLKMLELFAGLSNGLLTDIQGADLATATAIRASMHNTFAFVNTMRKIIENGVDNLIYGIAMLYNANSQSGIIGQYNVKYEWDDSLMENSTEMFNMLLQSQSLDIVSKAEVRSWLKNESIDQAERKIKDIEQDGIDEFNIEDDQSNQSDVTTTEVKQQAQEAAGKTLNGA